MNCHTLQYTKWLGIPSVSPFFTWELLLFIYFQLVWLPNTLHDCVYFTVFIIQYGYVYTDRWIR